MIATEEFVFVHVPKTGGTFVASVLTRLYRDRAPLFSRLFRKLRGASLLGCPGVHKHAGCNDILPQDRHKPILAVVRNPYDRTVSQYEFGWWKTRPERLNRPDEIRKRYPKFPDITFAEFLDMVEDFGHVKLNEFQNDRYPPGQGPGLQTKEFIRLFARNPIETFAAIDDNDIDSGRYADALHDAHFLRMDALNQSLHDFLLTVGFPPDEVAFILTEGKILPYGKGRQAEQKWEKYYTPELKARVRQQEKLLFTLFPEFDV